MEEVENIGLSREAYISDEWYQRELENIFSKNWCFAGIIDEVRSPGDYICLNIGRSPVFVIRGNDGALRAFHNICRHRGTVLLRGKGNLSDSIQCGYHCWRYELTGELRSIPQESRQFSGINKGRFSLHPAGVRVFKGMIFVHVNGIDPIDFDIWIGEFEQYFGPYDLSHLTELRSVRYSTKANWKLFIENHIESYHLWYAHKNSILGLSHEKQVNFYYNGHWSFFQPTLVPGKMVEFEKYIPSRIIAPNEDWYGSGDHLLYPNLGVVTGAKFVAILKANPITASSCEVEIRMFGIPLQDGESDLGEYYEDAGSSEQYNVNEEDIDLCERIQEGMFSEFGGVGALAVDYEQSIKRFHDKYMSQMVAR